MPRLHSASPARGARSGARSKLTLQQLPRGRVRDVLVVGAGRARVRPQRVRGHVPALRARHVRAPRVSCCVERRRQHCACACERAGPPARPWPRAQAQEPRHERADEGRVWLAPGLGAGRGTVADRCSIERRSTLWRRSADPGLVCIHSLDARSSGVGAQAARAGTVSGHVGLRLCKLQDAGGIQLKRTRIAILSARRRGCYSGTSGRARMLCM